MITRMIIYRIKHATKLLSKAWECLQDTELWGPFKIALYWGYNPYKWSYGPLLMTGFWAHLAVSV